jgi:hypothetical protein
VALPPHFPRCSLRAFRITGATAASGATDARKRRLGAPHPEYWAGEWVAGLRVAPTWAVGGGAERANPPTCPVLCVSIYIYIYIYIYSAHPIRNWIFMDRRGTELDLQTAEEQEQELLFL